MSDDEIEEALRVRAKSGYEGGMPLGAKITLEEAERRCSLRFTDPCTRVGLSPLVPW